MQGYTPLILAAGAGLISTHALAAQYLSAEQAQHALFPDANRFMAQAWQLDHAQMQEIEKRAGLPARSLVWRAVAAYRDEQLLGFVVFDSVIGKFELIDYAVGLSPAAEVRAVEILTYRESHGYEVRNPNWRRQFVGKRAATGLRVGEGIANISGATLSCTHVTDGVRRIAALAQVWLGK